MFVWPDHSIIILSDFQNLLKDVTVFGRITMRRTDVVRHSRTKIYSQTNMQTNRQMVKDKQTHKQTDKLTDRQTLT